MSHTSGWTQVRVIASQFGDSVINFKFSWTLKLSPSSYQFFPMFRVFVMFVYTGFCFLVFVCSVTDSFVTNDPFIFHIVRCHSSFIIKKLPSISTLDRRNPSFQFVWNSGLCSDTLKDFKIYLILNDLVIFLTPHNNCPFLFIFSEWLHYLLLA